MSLDLDSRWGLPRYGCMASNAINNGHERSAGTGVCYLCGDGPRQGNRVAPLPMVGEVVAQLIVDGGFINADKEQVWRAVSLVAPGYLRAAFDRHWAASMEKK